MSGKKKARTRALRITEDSLKAKLTPEQIVAYNNNEEYRAKVNKLYEEREAMDSELTADLEIRRYYDKEVDKLVKIATKKDEELYKRYVATKRLNKEEMEMWQNELAKTSGGLFGKPSQADKEKIIALRANIRRAQEVIDGLYPTLIKDQEENLRNRNNKIKELGDKYPTRISVQKEQDILEILDNFDISALAGNPPNSMGLGTGPKSPKKEKPVEEAPASPKPKGEKYLKALAKAERDKEKDKTEKPYSPLTKEQVEKGNDLEKAKIKLHSVTQVVNSIPKDEVSERSEKMKASMAEWLYKVKTKSKALLETDAK